MRSMKNTNKKNMLKMRYFSFRCLDFVLEAVRTHKDTAMCNKRIEIYRTEKDLASYFNNELMSKVHILEQTNEDMKFHSLL